MTKTHRTATWTAFVSWPPFRRGEYDEEIDVTAATRAAAIRAAEALLADPEEYEPGGKVRRIEQTTPNATIWRL